MNSEEVGSSKKRELSKTALFSLFLLAIKVGLHLFAFEQPNAMLALRGIDQNLREEHHRIVVCTACLFISLQGVRFRS